MAVLFYFERSWKNLKKIKSYTGIWNVEKVLYAINDFNLPFPVTFTQITWFVITEFIIILFGDIPPLSMIKPAFFLNHNCLYSTKKWPPFPDGWACEQSVEKDGLQFLIALGLGPVSYTHLDVYKRQPVRFSPYTPIASMVESKTRKVLIPIALERHGS